MTGAPMNASHDHIVLLLGPTAVGKTAVACALQDLAATLPEINGARLISVDSAMVYRGLDIGTAKPTAAEQVRYPHALIDIRDPADTYSAADFVADADAQIRAARAAGELPVLVGGTMLYAKRFTQGIADLPKADPEVRRKLQARLDQEGGEALHAELSRLDPDAAAQIHPNNPQRLLRALEVLQLTGRSMSEQWVSQDNWQSRLGGSLHTVAILPDERAQLYERIEARFDAMLEAGFLEEVMALRQRGDLHLELPSMRSVGYRQAWMHLDGATDAEAFRREAVVATRRLAKRQLTWLRQWDGLTTMVWGEAETLARKIVGQLFPT